MQVLCDDYRAATPLEGSLYCAYHTEATRGAAAPNGDQARSSSSRRLSVLRLPHRKQEAARGDQARSSSSRRLSVLRLPHRSEAGPSGAQRRPSAQQLLQKALCTAPATQQRSAAQRRPAATTRAAAPPEGSLYCACHTAAKRGPAAPRGDQARSSSSRRLSVLRLPHRKRGGPSCAQRRRSAQKLVQEALCTAPATQKPPHGPAAPSGDQARSRSFRRLSILRLPRKSHRTAQRRPAATKRAAAPSGGSLYCACHAKTTARPSGAQRRPSAQQLLQEALCTAPATQKQPRGPAAPSGDQARSSSVRRLSVLRLPRKSQRAEAPPGGSLYCACHTTATERPSGAQRRPSAQQLLQEALCTAPATQKQGAPQRRPAATKRAEAPPGGSLYCACHTKATERPSGAQRRPSAQKLLQEALCTAPATQKPARGPAAPSGDQARSSSFRRLSVLRLPRKSHRAAERRPAATKRAAAPSGGSLYCTCHAKATARPSGAQRRPSAQQLLQEALCTAPATQKPARGPAAPSGDQARSSSFRRLSVLRLPRKSTA